jgi:hypothetical protein
LAFFVVALAVLAGVSGLAVFCLLCRGLFGLGVRMRVITLDFANASEATQGERWGLLGNSWVSSECGACLSSAVFGFGVSAGLRGWVFVVAAVIA